VVAVTGEVDVGAVVEPVVTDVVPVAWLVVDTCCEVVSFKVVVVAEDVVDVGTVVVIVPSDKVSRKEN
jgi:hypothetical protein